MTSNQSKKTTSNTDELEQMFQDAFGGDERKTTDISIDDNIDFDENALFDDNSGLGADEDTELLDEMDDVLQIDESFHQNLNTKKNSDDFGDMDDQQDEYSDDWAAKLVEDEEQRHVNFNQFSDAGYQKREVTQIEDDELLDFLQEMGAEKTQFDDAQLDSKIIASRVAQRMTHQQPTAQMKAEKISVLSVLLWGIACVFMLVLLLAQYIYFNFDTLAKNNTYRNQLTSICQSIGCSVPAADIAKFSISNQHMLPVNGQNNKTELVFTLNNTSNQDQLFPSLQIMLTNPMQQQTTGLVATPRQYLEFVDQRLMLAQSKKEVRLTINSPLSDISHYNVSALY